MNVQVEHKDNHIARLIVSVDAKSLQSAKQKAAQRLSKEVRLPGFRPGKAPYNVILQRFGEKAILSESVDILADQTYKNALDESKVEPVAQGSLVDFTEEDGGTMTLIFEVPKQPTVDLKGYRDLRLELAVEPVTDEAVEKAVQAMRDEQAVVEAVERPAEVGDELEADIHVTFWHDEEHDHDHEEDDDDDHDDDADDDHDEDDDDDDDEEDDDDDDDHEHEHGHSHDLVDQKNAKLIVREAGSENDLFPGFSAQLIGLSAGESKEFDLTLPEDFSDEMMAGKPVHAKLTVHKVSSRTLPELDDAFAQSVTNNQQQTVDDLRTQTRKDLEQASTNAAEAKLFDEVVDQIVEQADIQYPEVLVQLYIDGLLRTMERMLQQQFGLTMKDYLRVTNRNEAEVREEQRENAIKRLKRELVFSELIQKENLSLSDDAIDQEIDKISADFGEQAAIYRQILNTPQNRDEIANQVLNRNVLRRVIDIVTGQNPAIEAPAAQITLAESGESQPVTDKPSDQQ